MGKIRVYILAKELKLQSRQIIEQARRLGADVSSPTGALDEEIAARIREIQTKRHAEAKHAEAKRAPAPPDESQPEPHKAPIRPRAPATHHAPARERAPASHPAQARERAPAPHHAPASRRARGPSAEPIIAPASSPVEPVSPPRIDDVPVSPLLVPEPAPPDKADKADKAFRKSFLIDGLNVCCWGKKPSLAPLLSLAAELKRKDALFICFFDANTRFILAEHGERETYEKLIEKYDCFGEVPGGTQADDFLLFRAHKTGEAIITNDQYRDAKYREKYKWLRSVSPRLCKGVVLGGYLSIPELDVHARVSETLEGAIREYDGASGALPAAASPVTPVTPVTPVSGERTGARRRRRRGRKRPSDAKSSESKPE